MEESDRRRRTFLNPKHTKDYFVHFRFLCRDRVLVGLVLVGLPPGFLFSLGRPPAFLSHGLPPAFLSRGLKGIVPRSCAP